MLRTCYAQTSAEQEQIYGIDVPVVQLAVYAKSSTLYIWSHGCKSKFFWLDGLLTISYNYGAMLSTLRVPLQAYQLHACKCAPLLGTEIPDCLTKIALNSNKISSWVRMEFEFAS